MNVKPAVLQHLPVPDTIARGVLVQSATFAATVFVSAFLLFQVQPLIGKFILPWFGGSPAVWTTCMLFFQVILFLGYAYAHATVQWLSPRQQRAVHLVLIAAAIVVLPITPSPSWKPDGSEHPTRGILLLLSVTVGLAYFVLSSTGPLLQAWFSRVCPGRSPYRLYSLSNVGSLLALISFPLVVEPLWPSPLQAQIWSALFLLFALLCGVCAVWVGETPSPVAPSNSPTAVEATPTFGRRVLWLLLPACSCLMMLATTNEVTQDVAPIPFLWVFPLGLYLLSFIICFDHEAWYRRNLIAPLTAVFLVLVAGLSEWPDWFALSLTTAQELFLYFAALFGVCMVCHGEVVRLRPQARHLTEFYLVLSAGGALGGILVSLIAPQLFTTYFEWPLSLAFSFIVSALTGIVALREQWTAVNPAQKNSTPPHPRRHLQSTISLGIHSTLALAGLVLIGIWRFPVEETLYRGRNFYGTVSVANLTTDNDEPFRAFVSGHINHGRQWTSAQMRRIPTTYYGEGTAPALAIASAQQRPSIRIGVVGMGIGTLATYTRPDDIIRFYEINPEVEWIAKNHFTFLSDCRGHCDLVLGDARLELERESANQFDVLILDAFTSDAPPVHLLTKEAFEQYGRHLQSDGLLVVNVTNTYLELAPVVARIGDELDWHSIRVRTRPDATRLAYRTDYLILARRQDLLPNSPQRESLNTDAVRVAPLWTDQYSNLFQVLKRD